MQRRCEIEIDGFRVELLEFNDTVETVEKASTLSNEPPSSIVKTILAKTREGYIVFLVRGDRRIDFKKASRTLNTSIALANPSEVKEVLGVEIGAVTPLDSKVKRLRVIMDPAILEKDKILCGGGSLNRLYKINTRDLVKFLSPEIMDLFK
ncbi:MAG: YbaK/EbsC family protein [Desulfurococcaceae archaeon]